MACHVVLFLLLLAATFLTPLAFLAVFHFGYRHNAMCLGLPRFQTPSAWVLLLFFCKFSTVITSFYIIFYTSSCFGRMQKKKWYERWVKKHQLLSPVLHPVFPCPCSGCHVSNSLSFAPFGEVGGYGAHM